MRFEFKIDLAAVRFKSKRRAAEVSAKMPRLRKHLVLAYQLQKFCQDNNISRMEGLLKYIPLSRGRICQLLKLLLLSPKIQEEILLAEKPAISKLGEHTIRKLSSEIDWNKQQEMWKEIKEG
ncbi:MAG: hypothetical protein JW871_05495 [Endomicrobiales bacterium]|nr:hypothetical protein [Endomicrobiales bacterium]